MVLKKALDSLIKNNVLKTADVVNVHIYCDEHTTATNGLYELKEALLNEFKYGTFNMEYDLFYDPILPTMNALNVNYCNSAKTTLVRAADIIANHIYYKVTRDKKGLLKEKGIFIYAEPSNKIVKNGLEVFRK